MPSIRGITISVGYADLLNITLVRNMRHMTEIVVVTTPEDEATKAVAREVPGVRVVETNVFTEQGARFNKGWGMEIGLDALGRHGWILIHDADVLLPPSLPLDQLQFGKLHGARRRILADPAQWTPDLDWSECPPTRDGGAVGFFQLAHADDPAIKDRRPWYDVSFGHAGGGDCYYMHHWPKHLHTILPVDVLHLGRPDENWMGRDPEGRDLMAKYVYGNRWRRGMKNFDPAAAERAGDLPGRIEVPGYERSTFQMPFERRAQETGGG